MTIDSLEQKVVCGYARKILAPWKNKILVLSVARDCFLVNPNSSSSFKILVLNHEIEYLSVMLHMNIHLIYIDGTWVINKLVICLLIVLVWI